MFTDDLTRLRYRRHRFHALRFVFSVAFIALAVAIVEVFA